MLSIELQLFIYETKSSRQEQRILYNVKSIT